MELTCLIIFTNVEHKIFGNKPSIYHCVFWFEEDVKESLSNEESREKLRDDSCSYPDVDSVINKHAVENLVVWIERGERRWERKHGEDSKIFILERREPELIDPLRMISK